MKDFQRPLPQAALNLDAKKRSSVFPWRGQFSPQLIENILEAYCREGSVILDPFCGSGTVLYEAGRFGLEAIGVELNPAAHILSKTYELINRGASANERTIESFARGIRATFQEQEILQSAPVRPLELAEFEQRISVLSESLTPADKILLHTFVILLDLHNKAVTPAHIHAVAQKTTSAVRDLPYSPKQISALLGDARDLPLESQSVDFVVTSPPYINVFNYHQNYRKSAESLGWDLLTVARSEIGSNRANRGNRFLTVIQYCLDMATALVELRRVATNEGRMVFVVGHESRVLGVPFYNAEIIGDIATNAGIFHLVQRQKRVFQNKFGQSIREDLLHFEVMPQASSLSEVADVAKQVAASALSRGLKCVEDKHRATLLRAIESVERISNTPIWQATCVPAELLPNKALGA